MQLWLVIGCAIALPMLAALCAYANIYGGQQVSPPEARRRAYWAGVGMAVFFAIPLTLLRGLELLGVNPAWSFIYFSGLFCFYLGRGYEQRRQRERRHG